MVASSTSASHASPSSVTPPSARNCTSRLRSRTSMARVQAPWTTAASSTGTTHMVRRIPSIRSRLRSS